MGREVISGLSATIAENTDQVVEADLAQEYQLFYFTQRERERREKL